MELLRQGWRKREADLSKFLSERNVEQLRAEFARRDHGLTKAEFVYVMDKCMVSPLRGIQVAVTATCACWVCCDRMRLAPFPPLARACDWVPSGFDMYSGAFGT